MRRTLITTVTGFAFLLLAASCSSKKQASGKPEGNVLLSVSTPVSFHPTGKMFVYSEGGVLAIKRVGDKTVYFLTRKPPADKTAKKKAGKRKPKPKKKPKCVPAKPGAPLPGPQGGWHGHPAWSPTGRYIAFSARWKDGNCKDDDDQDWDIWVVDVAGLTADNLDRWIKELKPKGKKKAKVKKYVLLGIEEKGFRYYQLTRSTVAEHFPTWAFCNKLAYRTRTSVHLKELKHLPEACTTVDASALAGKPGAPPAPKPPAGARPCPCKKPGCTGDCKDCAADCPHAKHGKGPCTGDCPHAKTGTHGGKPCPAECLHGKHGGKDCPAHCPHARPGTRPTTAPAAPRTTRPAVRPAVRPTVRPTMRPAMKPAVRPRATRPVMRAMRAARRSADVARPE